MKKRYEDTLPNDYEAILTIDATKKKTAIIFNVLALAVMIIVFIIGILILQNTKDTTLDLDLIFLIVFIVLMIAMLIIHELIHGLFYKIYTKQKLTFGMTWSCAFCGVPKIYVYRNVMMITCMAPCVILSLTMILLMIFIPNFFICLLILLLFSLHFGGCVGDIYVFLLLLFKYKDKDILLRDTGPLQTIYKK